MPLSFSKTQDRDHCLKHLAPAFRLIIVHIAKVRDLRIVIPEANPRPNPLKVALYLRGSCKDKKARGMIFVLSAYLKAEGCLDVSLGGRLKTWSRSWPDDPPRRGGTRP